MHSIKTNMKKLKKFLKDFGPGFITGASDDDPSGIATYSQTGAQFGYSQLWTSLFSLPFMVVIQEMCGRIGMVTGRGIAAVIRKNYGKTVLYFCVFLLLFANTINIGADLGAMAASAQLLLGVPFVFWLVGITLFSILMQIMIPYKTYQRFLKYAGLTLLAYVVAALVIKQDWSAAFHATLIPHITWNKAYILNIVALLGTTISPYMFFWQADEEVEEEIEFKKLHVMGQGKPKVNKKDIVSLRWDTFIGMLFSNIITFFIIVTAASTLNANGIFNVATANEAAEALRPFAGNFAYVLFAAGIIGTGLLAVPVLAGSASYALSEALNIKEGLYRKFKQAHGFYAIIIIATLVGLFINFSGIPPFKMLYYAAILNGICAPVLMVVILLIANNKKIMGEHKNRALSNVLGILITAVMGVCAIALLAAL
jgi:NRAMP (natural resistance-associated macrophage protein)-like metal ion transporter